MRAFSRPAHPSQMSGEMRPGSLAALVVAAPLAFGLAGCSSVRGPDADAPLGTLTDSISELQMHLQVDTYQSAAHLRDSGPNAFEISLQRLDRLASQLVADRREAAPEALVIQFARGRALERLRRYAEAAGAFAIVAARPGPLRDAALRSARTNELFASHILAAHATIAADAARDVSYLDAWVSQWTALAEALADSAHGSLAREEAEAWEQARVEHLLGAGDPDGALRACHQLVAHHRESKHYAGHLIRLGDLYAESIRRRHVSVLARRAAFDSRQYERDLERAFSAYQMAAEAREPHLRRLAAMKIEALLAYHEGVQSDVR